MGAVESKRWICREPDACFECPYPDCIKDRHGSGKNVGSHIIATFTDGTVEYFSKKQIGELAKRLDVTSRAVLEAVNGDSWCEDVFLVWGRLPDENKARSPGAAKLKAKKSDASCGDGDDGMVVYWADGGSKEFDSAKGVAEYLGIHTDTVYYRMYKNIPINDVIIQRPWQTPPQKETFYRSKWSKGSRFDVIPVPETEACNAMKYSVLFDDGSIEEYYSLKSLYLKVEKFVGYAYGKFLELCKQREKIKGIRGITIKGDIHIPNARVVTCTWQTGEVLRFPTIYAVEKALHVKSATVKKYIALGKPYRGVTFEEGGAALW